MSKINKDLIKIAKINYGLRYSIIDDQIWVEICIFLNWPLLWGKKMVIKDQLKKTISQLDQDFMQFI